MCGLGPASRVNLNLTTDVRLVQLRSGHFHVDEYKSHIHLTHFSSVYHPNAYNYMTWLPDIGDESGTASLKRSSLSPSPCAVRI